MWLLKSIGVVCLFLFCSSFQNNLVEGLQCITCQSSPTNRQCITGPFNGFPNNTCFNPPAQTNATCAIIYGTSFAQRGCRYFTSNNTKESCLYRNGVYRNGCFLRSTDTYAARVCNTTGISSLGVDQSDSNSTVCLCTTDRCNSKNVSSGGGGVIPTPPPTSPTRPPSSPFQCYNCSDTTTKDCLKGPFKSMRTVSCQSSELYRIPTCVSVLGSKTAQRYCSHYPLDYDACLTKEGVQRNKCFSSSKYSKAMEKCKVPRNVMDGIGFLDNSGSSRKSESDPEICYCDNKSLCNGAVSNRSIFAGMGIFFAIATSMLFR